MQPSRRDDERPPQEYWRHSRSNKGASPQVNSPNAGPVGNNRPQNNNSNNRNNNSGRKEGRDAQNSKVNSNNNVQFAGNNNSGSNSKSQQVTPKIGSKTADNQPSSSGPSSGRGGKQDHVVELFKTPNSAKPHQPKQTSNNPHQLQQQQSVGDDSTPSRGGALDDKAKNAVIKKVQETPQSTEKDSPSAPRSAKSNSKVEAERAQKKRFKALVSEIPSEMQGKLRENLVTITDKHDKLGFHCDPCSCNFATLEEVNEHIDSYWLHLYKKQLRKNPPPKVTLSPEHAQKLTEVIEDVFVENYALQSDYERWAKIAAELQSHLAEVLETVKVEPAGLQGCHLAMKSDTLNLWLSSSDGKPTNPARLLANLYQNPELSARCGLVFDSSSSGDDNLRLVRKVKYTFSGESEPVQVTLSVMCLDQVTKSLLEIYRQQQPEILPRLSIAFQYWAKCVGFFEHNALIPEALAVMTAHFLQHCPQPLLPILSSNETKPDPNFKSTNQSSVGQLWVSMLHYFSFAFQYDKYAIDMVSPRGNLALRDPEAKHSNRRRLFVNTAQQDPQQRFNLARNLKPDLLFDFFHDRIMCSFRYFSTLPGSQAIANLAAVANLTERLEKVALDQGEEGGDLCREVWVSQLVNDVVSTSIDQAANPPAESDQVCKDLAAKIVAEVLSEAILTLAGEQQVNDSASPIPASLEKPFTFSRKAFLNNATLTFPIACNYCGTTDHPSSSCKRILWTKPDSLPEMTESHLRKLDQSVLSVVKDMSNWPDWNKQIDAVVNDVMNAIKEQYPEARLHLYGSCRNGFQVWPCDVDLCLTFNGTESVPADQVERVLVSIKKLLQKSRRFVMTIAVTSCRVPVVKFVHRETELEGDICLYNQLALHNTRLLHTYSALDERCRMLGLMAKHVFKQADICDASRGFLSSYAYILMVIFYLQHRSPAVLPCLQQMTPELITTPSNGKRSNSCSRTPRVVDGWDTWFFEDTIEATRSAWSGYGLNKESIGSLWLGFLRFYTEQFDLSNQVVAIRQLEPLLKLEKSIDTHVLAIEDPFNLSHNLGSGLRATAYAHIMKVFVKSRSHFGTPMETLPSGQKSWEKYLLDPNQYSVADGPTGFQCHFCKCVGHTYAKCERRLAALEEEKEEHQRLQRLRMEQQLQMQQAAALMGAPTGASPRFVPYQRPMAPGAPRQPGLPNQSRSIDAETGPGGVPLPISALLSPNKTQQEQLEKMGVPTQSMKSNGDPAVAQALAQLYPDLVGATANKATQQQPSQQNASQQPHGPTSPHTPLSSAFLSSMTSTLTPLLIDCHAHRQSLLSMNQVLTQLYAALTMLTNQLEQSNQQQQQGQQPGQQQQMTQQLTVVVDQLRTGIGAFCGHVVQCCHHFDTQISSPVLQLASQVYQQQQTLTTGSSSSTPSTSTPAAAATTASAATTTGVQQPSVANNSGARMHQHLQQLIAMQAAVAVSGPAPSAPGGLSFPQLQQWLQQNQNVPAPSLGNATNASSGSVPRFQSGLFPDQLAQTTLSSGHGTGSSTTSWPPHSQSSDQTSQATPHPTIFGFPMNFASVSGSQQTQPVQPGSSSTNSSGGGAEPAGNHNPAVFPNPFPNALFGGGEKPQ